MRRPLGVLGLFFSLGIWLATGINISLSVLFFLCCLFWLSSLVFYKRGRLFSLLIFLFSLLSGATLLKNSQVLPNCHIARNLPAASSLVSIKGVVNSDPLSTENKTTFIFLAEELILQNTSQKVCGKILVKAIGNHNFPYGESLILTGALHKPFNFSLSPRLNYRDYLKQRGIYVLLNINQKGRVEDLGINKGNPIMLFAYGLKQKMEEIINNNLAQLPASILNAMLLGERKSVPQTINDAMIKTGTVHILPRLYTKMPSVAL